MTSCNEIIISVYNSKELDNLLSKINPEAIRDDLRQEIAVALLDIPCKKIMSLFASNDLIRYALAITWNMAIGKGHKFSISYQRKELGKAIDYVNATKPMPELPIELAYEADAILKTKNKDIHDDHEARIFNKYVELGSMRKVASYYRIPLNHVCNVVNKVKSELKCLLLS